MGGEKSFRHLRVLVRGSYCRCSATNAATCIRVRVSDLRLNRVLSPLSNSRQLTGTGEFFGRLMQRTFFANKHISATAGSYLIDRNFVLHVSSFDQFNDRWRLCQHARRRIVSKSCLDLGALDARFSADFGSSSCRYVVQAKSTLWRTCSGRSESAAGEHPVKRRERRDEARVAVNKQASYYGR